MTQNYLPIIQFIVPRFSYSKIGDGTIRKRFPEFLQQAQKESRRLVAPLMGFPGLQLTKSTIKLAQQNYGEHFKVIKALSDTFHPDILFPLMDLSVEANALGRYTLFPKEDSATVVKDHFDFRELEYLEQINITFDTRLLGYVETVKLMSIGLPSEILRGAYVIGPFSLASLLMGADEAAMATILNPDKLEALCELTTEKIQEYIRLLIAAGAQVICILEPSAVMLGPNEFEQFSARFVKHINDSFKYSGISTIYHTCGNTMHLIEKMIESGVDALSLDSDAIGVNLPQVAKKAAQRVVIMGNINPTGKILTGTPDEVKEEVIRLLESMDDFPNFVLSTGCDLPQETPLENIHAFMKVAKSYRVRLKFTQKQL